MLKSSNYGYFFHRICVDLCNIAQMAATAIATATATPYLMQTKL